MKKPAKEYKKLAKSVKPGIVRCVHCEVVMPESSFKSHWKACKRRHRGKI